MGSTFLVVPDIEKGMNKKEYLRSERDTFDCLAYIFSEIQKKIPD